MLEVCNPPGEEVDDILSALAMVRAGKKINFVGAGATVDFDERGDQLNRSFLHQVIENGKNRIVGVETVRFYQRRGFYLVRVHRGAVDRSRASLKPEIPPVGAHGIPLRDEIELRGDRSSLGAGLHSIR